jgi:glycosidase
LQEHDDWTTDLDLPDGRKNIGLWDGETRLTTWFDEHIPTLDLERKEVCDPMTDSALHWVRNFDFDGFRHDACKHIPLDYWRMLTNKMRMEMPDRSLWMIGETYGDTELIGSYVKTGMIDSQFDFNVYHDSRDIIIDESRSMRDLVRTIETSEAAYGSHHTMGNITGNHDKTRFITLAGEDMPLGWYDDKAVGWHREVGAGDMDKGYARMKLLKTVITTIPGVPCIYQGDEYGVPGANDPDNRDMMTFECENDYQQKELAATKVLFNYRRESMPLMYGDYRTLYVDDAVWVFLRHYMGDWVVVAMNIREAKREVIAELPSFVTCDAVECGECTGFDVDIATEGANVVCCGGGKMQVTLPGYGYVIVSK